MATDTSLDKSKSPKVERVIYHDFLFSEWRVAEILQKTFKEIQELLDTGELTYHPTIGDRKKVTRGNLIRYMEKNGIATDALEVVAPEGDESCNQTLPANESFTQKEVAEILGIKKNAFRTLTNSGLLQLDNNKTIERETLLAFMRKNRKSLGTPKEEPKASAPVATEKPEPNITCTIEKAKKPMLEARKSESKISVFFTIKEAIGLTGNDRETIERWKREYDETPDEETISRAAILKGMEEDRFPENLRRRVAAIRN